MSRWRWVHATTQEKSFRERLREVGIEADGSLWNPNGYPEELVRSAVLAAEERRRAKRSAAALKATATRQRRQERRVYEAAKKIGQGSSFGPSLNCRICGRGLGDKESIERGIGSECWQGVMGELEELQNSTCQKPDSEGVGK